MCHHFPKMAHHGEGLRCHPFYALLRQTLQLTTLGHMRPELKLKDGHRLGTGFGGEGALISSLAEKECGAKGRPPAWSTHCLGHQAWLQEPMGQS
jgi:hypothetical protein